MRTQIHLWVRFISWLWLPVLFFLVNDFYNGVSTFPWFFEWQGGFDPEDGQYVTVLHPLIVKTLLFYALLSFWGFYVAKKRRSLIELWLDYGPLMILLFVWIFASHLGRPSYFG